MTNIYGSMVVKNEASRYLIQSLNWMPQFFEKVFIFDDQSTDGTPDLCRDAGCEVVVRPDEVPAFIEHEGRFRKYAWDAFEKIINPKAGDWILSYDADEFLSGIDGIPPENLRSVLENSVDLAKSHNMVGIIVRFLEIFKHNHTGLYERTDGFWGNINGPRLFAYRIGGEWNDKAMGCGSEPRYVAQGPIDRTDSGLRMLHLGYAKDEDKKIKSDRYTALYDHGHNDSHIQSILKPPTLRYWDGYIPDGLGVSNEN